MGAIEPQFFARLLAGLGLSADVPNQFDVARYGEMRELFTSVLISKTRDEWTAIFGGTDVCAPPVLSWTEAASNEHLLARRTVIDVDRTEHPAPAPRFSRSVTGPADPPPRATTALTDVGW